MLSDQEVYETIGNLRDDEGKGGAVAEPIVIDKMIQVAGDKDQNIGKMAISCTQGDITNEEDEDDGNKTPTRTSVPKSEFKVPKVPSVSISPAPSMPSINLNKGEPVKEIFPALNGPQRVSSKIRQKTPLAPGHSALDWTRLTQRQSVRLTTQIQRFTLSDLKAHSSRTDAYFAYNGKVYDITQYLPFHPGIFWVM